MTQATTKLTLKPGKFDEVKAVLVDELEAMKEFNGLYDLSVTKVNESILVITATYFKTALDDSCAAAVNASLSPGRFLLRNVSCPPMPVTQERKRK